MMTDAGLDWKEVFMGISEHSDRHGNLSREAFGRACGVSAATGEAEDRENYKRGDINHNLEMKKTDYMNDFLAPRVYEVRAPQPGPAQPGQRRSRFD